MHAWLGVLCRDWREREDEEGLRMCGSALHPVNMEEDQEMGKLHTENKILSGM